MKIIEGQGSDYYKIQAYEIISAPTIQERENIPEKMM